ncbi:1-phosphatidylinositol 4-kinase [Malassezia sp. CBS 17886]|nr:1-phosphatidylinositol 4-kinase [Malassezia sp. CBS 17886]
MPRTAEAGADESTPLLRVDTHQGRDHARHLRHRLPLGAPDAARADYLVSVFTPETSGESTWADGAQQADDVDFYTLVERIRDSIDEGVQPRMISLGTSGSYFVRIKRGDGVRVVAVFKPMDEEPYGNLNLIPNFSYLSEVGASFLDGQLGLGIVPKTRLVGLASPAFHYLYKDRRRWEGGLAPLPTKVGSLQLFLHGYENASQFFRRNSLPGRPREQIERDLVEEHRAHRLSRRRERARLRMCFIALKRLVLCRYGPGPYGSHAAEDDARASPPAAGGAEGTTAPARAFVWTQELLRDLRLELEKLVLLDFLMRNTDRGLDNFMIRYNAHPRPGERAIMIGAIDNSLSFPHQHPRGLRDYPYGWLFLPTGLIGLPFSEETRRLFLPRLTDPVWWQNTTNGLRRIFRQDAHFHERIFEHQMELLRGQGWVIVQCLRNGSAGPIELCSHPKYLVRRSLAAMKPAELRAHVVTDLERGSTVLAGDGDAEEHGDAEHAAVAEAEERMAHMASRMVRIPSRAVDHAAHDDLARSAPDAPYGGGGGSMRGDAAAEPLGIDILERISAWDRPQTASRRPPAQRASRSAIDSGPAAHAVHMQPGVSEQMHSLDLAFDGRPHTYRHPLTNRHILVPELPVPVIVEQLQVETRRPWLRRY